MTGNERPTTVRALIEAVSGDFETAKLVYGHGTDNAWDEATLLVLTVAGLEDDLANLEQPLSDAQVSAIQDLARRRIETRTPLAYLLGSCWYHGLRFEIEAGLVVPRSPIGELLEQGCAPWLDAAPERILDLCTGTGCLGILAAHCWPDAQVTLVELDPAAAAVARRNVAAHELEERVTVLEGDLFDPLEDAARFELILANPPYVDAGDMRSLPPEFRHEPTLGLAGGDDGLDLVQRIVEEGPARLAVGGLLVCEVGMSAPALRRSYPALPFFWPEFDAGGEGVFLLGAGVPGADLT